MDNKQPTEPISTEPEVCKECKMQGGIHSLFCSVTIDNWKNGKTSKGGRLM